MRGCRAIALVTTRNLLPACLPVCLNADLCHPLQTRECFLTKYKHKREHMRGHTDTNKTHAYKNTHASKPAKGKERGNKGQAVPPSVFIKEKSDQTN